MSYIPKAINAPGPSKSGPSKVTPLSLTADQGYGYFPASPGLVLKNGRYEVVRMLGIGQKSSVFMVHDIGEEGLVLHSII
jgi:hypothetical protein